MGISLEIIGTGIQFLYRAPLAQTLRSFNTIHQRAMAFGQRQTTEWEKMFNIHTSNKELISEIEKKTQESKYQEN